MQLIRHVHESITKRCAKLDIGAKKWGTDYKIDTVPKQKLDAIVNSVVDDDGKANARNVCQEVVRRYSQ